MESHNSFLERCLYKIKSTGQMCVAISCCFGQPRGILGSVAWVLASLLSSLTAHAPSKATGVDLSLWVFCCPCGRSGLSFWLLNWPGCYRHLEQEMNWWTEALSFLDFLIRGHTYIHTYNKSRGNSDSLSEGQLLLDASVFSWWGSSDLILHVLTLGRGYTLYCNVNEVKATVSFMPWLILRG